MIPLLFPYTYVSRALAQRLSRWFDAVGVYQPSEGLVPEDMQRWCEVSAVQFRFPVRNPAQPLTRILEDFTRWSQMQGDRRGIGTAYRKALEGGPPFFDSDLPSHIRADIKRRISESKAADDESRDLLQARLFLAVAQELDRQSDTLENDMARLDDMELLLMESMHEPDEAAAALAAGGKGEAAGRREESDYMLAERLAAWAGLMAEDASLREPQAAAVFVACGRVVRDTLLEVYPDAVCGLRRAAEPADVNERIELQKQLTALSQRSEPAAAEEQPPADAGNALTAYVLPGILPLNAFARMAGRPELDFDAPGMFPTSRNSVFVFLL